MVEMVTKHRKPSITFDTNCVIFTEHNIYVDQLVEWKNKDLISIFKTDVVDTELKKQESIKRSQQIIEDVGIGRIGFTRVGHGIVGSEDDSFFNELMHVVFPETKNESPNNNKIFDIMNLVTHKLYDRDIFVTNDNDYLRKKDELQQHGIIVMNPKECITYFRNKFSFV